MQLFDILERTTNFELDPKFKIPAKTEATCVLCRRDPGIYRLSALLGENFPRWDLLSSKKGSLCHRCTTIIKAEPFRRQSWFLYNTVAEKYSIDFFDATDRERLIDHLFQTEFFPCYLAITFRKVKHNLFSDFSSCKENCRVVVDGNIFQYSIPDWLPVWDDIFTLYTVYHQTKDRILGLTLYPKSQCENDQFLIYRKRLLAFKDRMFYKVLINKFLYKHEEKQGEQQNDEPTVSDD